MKDFAQFYDVQEERGRKFFLMSVFGAQAILEGNDEFFTYDVLPDEELLVRDLSEKTIGNFKKFLVRVKADDLFSLLKNKQKIEMEPFGYYDEGEKYHSKKLYFDKDNSAFRINSDKVSTISVNYKFGQGIDNAQRISEDAAIQKIYQKELANVSPEAKFYLSSFVSSKGIENNPSLSRLVAEAYSIMNTPEMKDDSAGVSIVIQKVMKEFPRTVAAIMEKLAEYKAEL